MSDSLIHKSICGRSEKSFKTVQLTVLGHRDVFTVGDDGYIAEVPQRILTREEMMERIAEHGTVLETDEFMDLESGYSVIRGRILANGMVHAFQFVYDHPYEKLLDAALFGVRYSAVVEGGK